MNRKSKEYFLPGNQNRIAEIIGDSILDGVLKTNPTILLNLEILLKNQISIVAGEISEDIKVDSGDIITDVARELKFTGSTIFNSNSIRHINFLNNQVKDFIRIGTVTKGYAISEAPYYISIEESLSRAIGKILFNDNISKSGSVIVTTSPHQNTKKVESITINIEKKNVPLLNKDLILKKLDEFHTPFIPDDFKFIVNGIKGLGPDYLTGRIHSPLIGKDSTHPTKTGTLLCRHIAKHVVASNFAQECEIEIVWSIEGKAQSISMDCKDSCLVSEKWLKSLILDVFLFDLKSIVIDMNLNTPIFAEASTKGYFGHEPYIKNNQKYFPWESLDKLKYFVPL